MTLTDELICKINTLPDFVISKRFNNSLEKVLDKHPGGCSNRLVGSLLGLNEDEVEPLYQEIVKKLQNLLGVTL